MERSYPRKTIQATPWRSKWSHALGDVISVHDPTLRLNYHRYSEISWSLSPSPSPRMKCRVHSPSSAFNDLTYESWYVHCKFVRYYVYQIQTHDGTPSHHLHGTKVSILGNKKILNHYMSHPTYFLMSSYHFIHQVRQRLWPPSHLHPLDSNHVCAYTVKFDEVLPFI